MIKCEVFRRQLESTDKQFTQFPVPFSLFSKDNFLHQPPSIEASFSNDFPQFSGYQSSEGLLNQKRPNIQ